MSVFVSSSVYFLSFVPLWIAVLFIDIKSLMEGGGNKWTERTGIVGILVGLIVSLIILYAKFYLVDDEKYTFRIKDANERKTMTAELLLSYILPLFAFDFTLWYEMVEFLIFFLVLGFLCVRHNVFSMNIILEFMRYSAYDCQLLNADGIEVERKVISRERLSSHKGKDIQVKTLNNEYYLDLFDKKKSGFKVDN